MGLKLFGSSFSRGQCDCPAPTDPNPHRFKILGTFEANGWTIAIVQYPNCTNYDGKKVLLYDKSSKAIEDQTKLDPHFLEDQFSPVARFEPTERGLDLAFKIIAG